MDPAVTVCIPAYQSAHIIRETLDSVRAQTFENFTVLISVDQSTDDTAAVCHTYESDKRFKTFVQSSRLGWAGNVNFLLDRVTTPYFAILMHDDLWDKNYLQTLLGLIGERQSVMAYSKVERFGLKTGPFPCVDYPGTPFARVHAYLAGRYHALPVRAVAPSVLLKNGFRLREYGADGFQAERLGVFEMLHGAEGLYCPEPLYMKRVIKNSTVDNWGKWDERKTLDAWSAHHSAFVEVIKSLQFPDGEKQMLIDALPLHIRTMNKATRHGLRSLLPPEAQKPVPAKSRGPGLIEALNKALRKPLRAILGHSRFPRTPGKPLRIVVLLAVRNEALYIARCLEHLYQQGVETCVIDNDSTDATLSIVEGFRQRGVFRIERQAYPGYFDLVGQLRLKEKLIAEMDADWVIHCDADEIREASAPYKTLREGIEAADKAGYNAVNFDEFVFLPTADEEAYENTDFVETMRYYYFFEPRAFRQVKAWKNTGRPVDLVSSGGHNVKFKGRRIFPVNFILRHYIALSRQHTIQKYAVDRVYSEVEIKERRWHMARAAFNPQDLKVPDRKQLKNIENGVWDKSEPWKHHAFFGRGTNND
jgi:glycosyltransferase involved in cell wall biosynthesis